MDWILNNISLSWGLFAAFMIVLELALPHFGCLFPGIAAGFALAVSFQYSITVQLLTFTLTLLLGFVLLRPWLLKKTRESKGVPSRSYSLIHKNAVVTTGALAGQMGRVMIEGQDWAMRSDVKLNSGDEVKVKSVDGIVLIVNK